MSAKRTFLAAFLLVAVSVLYFTRVYQPSGSDRPLAITPEPAAERVFSLDRDDVVISLSVKNADDQSDIVFQRIGNEQWQIAKPVSYPAESMIVAGMLGLLNMMPRIRSLAFDGLAEHDFGFDQPTMKICVSTERKSEERCLLVGSKTVIGNGAYAKWADEPKYFIVGEKFLDAFSASLYTFRQKRIFNLLDQDTTEIRYRSEGGFFVLKRVGENWTLVKPIEAVLGRESVNELLTVLDHLYVKEFLDGESPENPKLGLQKPRRVLRVQVQHGARQDLIQGAAALGRNAYYARILETKAIVLISKSKLDAIDRAIRALV